MPVNQKCPKMLFSFRCLTRPFILPLKTEKSWTIVTYLCPETDTVLSLGHLRTGGSNVEKWLADTAGSMAKHPCRESLTYTIHSITRITIKTRAVEWPFSVGTVGISMAVVSEVTMDWRELFRLAFVDICKHSIVWIPKNNILPSVSLDTFKNNCVNCFM